MSEQRSIFDVLFGSSEKKVSGQTWEIRVDGASRGNPGDSGAGVYIKG